MEARYQHPYPDTDGLVVHYELEDGPSYKDEVVDVVQQGNVGKVFGALPAYPGYSFNGDRDYIKVLTPRGLPTGTQSRTLALWAKIPDAADYHTLLSYGGSGDGALWKMYSRQTTGVLWLYVTGGNVYGTTVITDNKWHLIVMTFDSNDGIDVQDVLFYIDGSLERLGGSVQEVLQTVEDHLLIGIADDEVSHPFLGLIDAVRIYNRALSAVEVITLYDLTRWRYSV